MRQRRSWANRSIQLTFEESESLVALLERDGRGRPFTFCLYLVDQVLPSLSRRQYGSRPLLFIEQHLSLQSTTILLDAASLSSMKTLSWTGGDLCVQYNKTILLSPFWDINLRSQQSRGAEIMYQPGSQEETEFDSLDLNEEASPRDPLQRGGQRDLPYHRMLRHPQASTEQRTVATTRLEGVRKGRVFVT